MAKPKRKTLPKDFDALLKTGDLGAIKAVFDVCEVDATGGYSKRTALAFHDCSDELARWLVAQGANINAEDLYGETPLHVRAHHWQGKIDTLIELGADVSCGDGGRGTPLHSAASSGNADAVRKLLALGAQPDALTREGLTPIEYALQRCENIRIAGVAAVAELLLAAQVARPKAKPSFLSRLLGKGVAETAHPSPDLKALVTKIGTEFEFHRSSFNSDFLGEISAGLDRLYTLFDVPPVPRRIAYDGKSPIIAKAAKWEDRHEELWALLVPSSGAASTVQGEVIRIGGRIHGELERNGGANWDADHRKMAEAWL